MPVFEVTAPNNVKFRVDAPEGATLDDAIAYVATDLFPKWQAANKPKEQSIMGSLQAGLAQPLGALGTTAETLGLTGTGAALKSAAEYITPEGYESAAGRFITPQEGDVTLGGFGIGSLPAAVAEQSGQIAGAIGTRAAGAAIGMAVGSVVPIVGTAAGAIAGAFLGPFLFEALQILGPVAQERAQKEGRDTPNASDIGAAALTAAGSGALNAIGAKYLPGGGQAAAPLMKRMGEGLIGEGGTELLQSIIEQTGSSLGTEAGLDISGKQAIAEGILGGVAGGATSGAFGRRPEGPRPLTDYERLRADIEAARTPTEQDLTDILKGSQKTALPPPPPAAAEAAAATEEVSGAPSRPRLTVKQPVLEGGVPPTEAITSADLPPSIGAPTAANRPGVMGRAIEEPYVPQTEEEIRLQEQRQTMADTGILPTVKTGPITREGRPVELRAEGAAAPLTPEIAIPMGAPPNKLDDFLKDTNKEPVSRIEGLSSKPSMRGVARLKDWVASKGGIRIGKMDAGEYGRDVIRGSRGTITTQYIAPTTAAMQSGRDQKPEEFMVEMAKNAGWLGPVDQQGGAVTKEDVAKFRTLLAQDISAGRTADLPTNGVYDPEKLAAFAGKGQTKEALIGDIERAVDGAIADAGYQNYSDEAYDDAVRRLVEGREDDPVVAVEKAIVNDEKVSGERKDTARRTAADDLNRLVFTDKMPLDNEAMTFAYDKIINDPTLDPQATYAAALKTKAEATAKKIPFNPREPSLENIFISEIDKEYSRAGGKRKSKKAKAKARAAKTAAQQPPTPVVEPVKTITAEDKAAAMQRIDDAIKKLAGDDTDQGRNLAVALKRAIADRKISVDQVLQAFKMSETVMRLLSGVTGAQKIKFAANLFGTFPDPENPGDFLADVEVGGTRSAYRQLIELSLNPDYNPLETTSHEIWHSLEDAFAASDRATGRIIDAAFKGATKIDEINPNLLRVLKNTRNPMVDGKESLYDTLMSRDIDAAVAEETSQFQKERELKAYVFGLLDQARQNNVQIGGLGSAFVRFVNFVKSVREAIGNMLSGQGFTTVEEAFAGVSAGVAQRGLNTGQKTSGPEYSRDPYTINRAEGVIDWDLPDDLLAEFESIVPAKKERVYRDKPVNRTRDEEYDAWSRGAAITDVNTGKPLVFYTGTSKDFIFKSFKVGRHGTWFTTDPEEASKYAENNDSQGVKKLTLAEYYDLVSKKDFSPQLKNTASRVIPVFLRVENPYRGNLPPEAKKDNYKEAQSRFFDTLRSQGYDAWIPPNRKTGIATNDSLVVILKDPTAIKSVFNEFKPGTARSTEFSRAKNFSRIGMPHKDILKRDPVLEENVAKLKDGEITPDQWDALVRKRKPVELYDIKNIPVPATSEQAINALYENKQDKYGLADQYYKEGDPVKLRLDIPAYAREDGKNAWVNAIHDGSSGTQTKKPTVYESVSAATDVTFSVTESAALATAKGAGKAPYATMRGGFKPITSKEAYAKAKQVHINPAWVQVGMDPTRHSFFYTRGDMKPVVAAEEVLQIGPLVYAKNPTYAGRSDFEFSRARFRKEYIADEGVRSENLAAFQKGNHPDVPNVVYHGTADVFSEFRDYQPNKKDVGWLGRGFYFTNNTSLASMYASMKRGNAPNVMPLHLSMKNPYLATQTEKTAIKEAIEAGDTEIAENIRKQLIDAGYDGVILDSKDAEGTKEFVVFKPTQVKSATGNIGTFDETNPDIRYSRVKVPPKVANAPNAAGAQVNSTRWSNITDTVKEFFDPWAFIDNAPLLRSFRNRLLGTTGTANELGQKIAADIAKGSKADSGHNGNVYKFLTTRGASPSMIVDPEVRKAAVRAKEEINKQGKRLVDAGFMTQESLDKNYDQYVPRLYLYYEATERGMKTPNMGLSKQEYLKLRDDQLSVEERELLGEIKNPAFLAYVAIARPARDMALAQYFAEIGTTSGVKWVLDDSVINWRGKMVSPFWMASEIKLMKTVTLPLAEQTDPARAAIVRKEIASMQKLLDKIPGYGPESKIPDGYQRLPDTPRYGVLRGAVVQEGIYDDLVGTFAMVPNTNQSMIGKILGDEQSLLVNANKVWKLGKVTFNVPSQVRNVISNIVALNVFGGIPLHKLPSALSAAAKSWSSKDQYWKDAQEYGIQGGTMAAAELKIMFNTMKQYQARGDKNNFFGAMATGRIAAKYLLSKPGEFYQNMEVLFKMALFIESRKNGKTVSESVDAAHDSLFDYTMVNPNIRWLRNAPLGLPFITYYYKVLPKLIQTAREHPLRFAPYIMLSYALPQIAMAQLDWDDEDYEAARKTAADYMRDKGSMYILPWKDSNGKIQMVDLGYFFPWAAFTDPVVTAAWYGEPVKGLKQLGGQFVPGGPLITAIAVMATGRDPFTDKQVVNPLDTGMNQFFSGLSYAWNQALPPMLSFDLNNMDNSGGAIPRIYNSLFSDGTGTDKRGMAKPDTLATAARLFGFNITPLDVVKQRAQNINYMLNTIHKREAYRAQIAKDQSMTPEKRRAEIQDLNKSIREDYLKIQKYATETARATKLED